jgi:undecaprenyl-diphosphatase
MLYMFYSVYSFYSAYSISSMLSYSFFLPYFSQAPAFSVLEPMSLFYYVGTFSPLILFFITLFTLDPHNTRVNLYLFGYAFTLVSNYFLKLLFKQPRPNQNAELFRIQLEHGKLIDPSRYGMPSGHAQLLFYSLSFVLLSYSKWPNMFWLYSFLVLIGCTQRVVFSLHTPAQVIVGAFFGVLSAFFVVRISSSLLRY